MGGAMIPVSRKKLPPVTFIAFGSEQSEHVQNRKLYIKNNPIFHQVIVFRLFRPSDFLRSDCGKHLKLRISVAAVPICSETHCGIGDVTEQPIKQWFREFCSDCSDFRPKNLKLEGER
jgi:hypothetical protein